MAIMFVEGGVDWTTAVHKAWTSPVQTRENTHPRHLYSSAPKRCQRCADQQATRLARGHQPSILCTPDKLSALALDCLGHSWPLWHTNADFTTFRATQAGPSPAENGTAHTR
mmetsp:Transcript_809/g.1440  ORF Transcript_809/g.1440 Transcript_809/m.1440 type:complete len:112 (+) Transcript_809:718-1053(+)